MKKLLFIFLLPFIMGCSESNSELLTIQSQHLDQRISDSHDQLKKIVDENGNTAMGINFLKHTEQLLKKLEALQGIISNKAVDRLNTEVRSFVLFSKNSPDSVELNEQAVIKSLKYIRPGNLLTFENNLKLFTSEVITQYREKYLSYFHIYDWVRPIVMPDRSTYNEGETYRADIRLEASNSGLLRSVQVDLPDDQKEFIDLPVSFDSRAHLEIPELKKGTSKIKIRVVEMNNGKLRSLEKLLEIKVE